MIEEIVSRKAETNAGLKIRPRRTRRTDALRRMVRETRLSVDNLIYPLFVAEGITEPVEIGSMPGQYRLPVGDAVRLAERTATLGVPAVLLFGIPNDKDSVGSEAYNDAGIVQQAIHAIKREVPELVVITDVCLCEYTDHGHCGIITHRNGTAEIDNDPSLDLLARMALSHAEAGADIVAPSDMMDGRVGAIRTLLDREGYQDTVLMAYSAKYASGFYGPFREAADSAPQFGDRRSYQMDTPNVREALREIALDVAEGADMIMVKPALSYLDIIGKAKERFDLPLVAYNVSGEYSMVKAAGRMGWIDEERVTREILTSIKRAGADMIITYHALDIAPSLR